MAMTPLHDYKREWENFKNAEAQPDLVITQKSFAEALGVSEMALSRHFSVFRREEDDEEIRQTLRRIAKNGNNKVGKFIDGFIPTNIDDAATLAKIGTRAADRVGFSPQAATINLTQQNINQIQIAPLFEGDQGEDIKRLIGG